MGVWGRNLAYYSTFGWSLVRIITVVSGILPRLACSQDQTPGHTVVARSFRAKTGVD